MRIIRLNRYGPVIGLLLAAGVWAGGFAFSEADAFTISPGRVELVMPAGESYLGSFIIGNPGDKSVKVKISVEDWSSEQDGRKIIRGDRDFLDWIRFMPQEAELEPNESRTIQYVVNIPKGAKGEYAAMIYFGDAPDKSKTGVSVRSRLGNALYAIVAGTEVVAGRISDIVISRVDPLKIDVSVENTGNIHIRPKGMISITEIKSGKSSARDPKKIELPFNDAGFPVLPGQIYPFDVWSKEAIGEGRYRFEFVMEFGKAKFNKAFDFTVGKEGEIKRGE